MFRVAIVGRSNVGKTTIFNSLVGERLGLENDSFNTTRDVNWRKILINESDEIMIADTGGNTSIEDETSEHIHNSIKHVMCNVELVFFVVDARTEPTYYELELLKETRNVKCPIYLVFNKTEGKKETLIHEYSNFSSRWKSILVSAIHRKGVGELKEIITKELKISQGNNNEKEIEKERPIRVGLIGRTNAGKSSLTNTLTNSKDKILVLETPHTTRDAISKTINYKDRRIELVDTAGMFRKSKQLDIVDWLALLKSEQQLRQIDVAIMLHDSSQQFAHLDKKIMGMIIDNKLPFVVAFNKSDIIKNPESIIKEVKSEINFFPDFEFIFVSAITKKNVYKLLDKVINIYERSMIMYDDNILRHLINTFNFTAQIRTKRRQPKLTQLIQSQEKGNHFTAYFTKTDSIHFTIRRQLVNHIKNSLGIRSIPIKIDIRIKQ